MKRKSIHSILITSAVVLSAFCFIYLNSISTNSVDLENPLHLQQVDAEDLAKKNEATLPDVQIVKHIIDVAKKMLPVSQ